MRWIKMRKEDGIENLGWKGGRDRGGGKVGREERVT